MAATLPVRLSARIVDGMGIEAFTTAYALVDPATTFTAALAFLNDWLAALDACTDGQIISGTITAVPALPGGLKSAATSGSRVEQTGILNFAASGSSHRWAEIIPALSDSSSVIAGGRIVLTSGHPVPALNAVLLGGSSSFEWTNSNSQVLTSFKDSLISFRKRHRALAGATLETP